MRAERRYRELRAKAPSVTRDQVLADLRSRDARDSERATAPLRPAEDAFVLDTSDLDIEAATAAAIATVAAALARNG